MNNEEYLTYEGARLIETSLRSFVSPYQGKDLRAALADLVSCTVPSEKGMDRFFWDYILLRLYMAERTIRNFKSGFGCMNELADGLRSSLEELPMHLRTISLLRGMEGSSLVIGIDPAAINGLYVEKRFSEFQSMEERWHAVKISSPEERLKELLSRMAKASGVSMTGPLLSHLINETKAYLISLKKKLSSLTPHCICRKAKAMTPSISSFSSQGEVDSGLLVILAGIAAGCLTLL